MSNAVLPVKNGSLGGLTWPFHDGGQPVTTITRAARDDVVAAAGPAVLLPSQQPLDYQLWAQHELPAPYTPLQLVQQQMSFFARHLAHEGSVPAELLEGLLLEQLEAPAAAAAAAAHGNRLAALQVQLPACAACETADTAAAGTRQQQQQQQQQSTQQTQQPELPGSAAAAPWPPPGTLTICHAGSAVLVLSVAGHARQQLVLTVLQPGAMPAHLPAAAAAGAAAGAAELAGAHPATSVQLSAAVAAVLDLGAPVEHVGLQQLPVRLATAAQQQAGPGHPTPVALVWARCHHKVYAALVTAWHSPPSTQRQQQGGPAASSSRGLAAAAGGAVTHWQLLLLGVAVLPQQVVCSVWHPVLHQAVLGCADSSVWVASLQDSIISQALTGQQQQRQPESGGIYCPKGAPAAAGEAADCLHPDQQLPKLLLQQQGVLGWLQAAAQAAGAVAGSDQLSPLLLAVGAHPRQLLAACGGTLMRHELDPPAPTAPNSSGAPPADQQPPAEVAGTPAAGPAAAGGVLPGKLLLQLPEGEAVCALSTWQGSQSEWQQAATSAAASLAATATATAGSATAAAGCVHVRHLLAVATSSRVLLLDLRKAADEPLLVWQHSIGSNGAPAVQPSLLLLLPAPPSAAAAAASCSDGCFRARPVQRPAEAAGDREPATAAAQGAGDEAAALGSLDPAADAGGIGSAPHGFDPRLYPSQMFQDGTESQGLGLLGDLGLFNTQASQIGDVALGGLRQGVGDRDTLLQQQQQQQGREVQPRRSQQQHAAGGQAVPLGPVAAAAAAARRAAAAATAAAGAVQLHSSRAGPSRSSGGSSSTAQNTQLDGVIVYASGSSGCVFSVNFRLQWAAGLAPGPLALGKAVDRLTASLQALTATQLPGAAGGPSARAAGPSTAPAGMAAAPATAGPPLSAAAVNQQQPGNVALGFVTKAMQSLALSATAAAAAASAATEALQEGRAGAANAGRGVRGQPSHSGVQRSSLGGWTLPSVVQATTPGPGQMLAQPVSSSVRGEGLQQLRLQRAAAAAARGDARSAAEVGLLPGAALDVSKSALARQALDLMAAAPDTLGLALLPLPWCWSGGAARALLLRSTADGDLCLQLCTTRQVRLAETGRQRLAGQQQQQQQQQKWKEGRAGVFGLPAAAGRAGGGVDPAAAEQQQQQRSVHVSPPPLLEVVLSGGAAAAVSGPPAAAAAGDVPSSLPAQQQQTQQPSQQPPEGPMPPADIKQQQRQEALQPQQQLQQGSAEPCVRSFEALQSWLDAAVEPPQLATAAAAAASSGRLRYKQQEAQQTHVERQVVQLPAHTGLVLQLVQHAQQGQTSSQQQQQQQQELPAACRWPTPQQTQPWDAAAAAEQHQAPVDAPYSLLTFEAALGTSKPPPPAAAAAAAPAAGWGVGDVERAMAGQPGPVTLLELQYKLLLQQREQLGPGRVGQGAGRKRSRAAEGLDSGPTQPQPQQEQAAGAPAAAAGSSRPLTRRAAAAAAAAAPAAAAAAGSAGADGAPQGGGGGGLSLPPRQPGVSGALARLAELRAAAQQQQQQRSTSPDAEQGGAGGVARPLSAPELAKLLQQQLHEPQLQLAAQLLAQQQWGDPDAHQQQQQRAQPDGGVAGPVALQQQLQQLHRLLVQSVPRRQQQQQQRRRQRGNKAEEQDEEGEAGDQQGLRQYQVHSITVPCVRSGADSSWAGPEQQQQQQGDDAGLANISTAAAAAAAAAAGQGGRRYLVQAAGPGVRPHDTQAGLQLAGAALALTQTTGAPVMREVAGLTQQQQQQQQQQGARQGARSSLGQVADGLGGTAGILGTQVAPAAPPAAAAAGGSSKPVVTRSVAAEYAPYGVLLQQDQAVQRLCDVTPRSVRAPPQQQQGDRRLKMPQAPAAAAAAAAGAKGGGDASGRAPPGLLAMAMSQQAQQRWLQLHDAWALPPSGAEGGAARTNEQAQAGDAGRQQQQQHNSRKDAAAAEAAAAANDTQRQKRQRREQHPSQQQQQQQQHDARHLGGQGVQSPTPRVEYIAVGSQQQRQQQQQQQQQQATAPGSALLAALGAGRAAPASAGRAQPQHRAPAAVRASQQQQQQQQQQQAAAVPGSALLAALGGRGAAPPPRRYTLLPPDSQEDLPEAAAQPPSSQQQQQQSQQQSQQPGGLLAWLSQPQQQRRPQPPSSSRMRR